MVGVAGGDGLEGAGQEDRAVLVGHHHGVLGGQLEGVIDRVIDDVAARRLIAEPLTDVPLRGAGPRGQGRAVTGPAPAIALYRPSRSPMCSSSPEMAAPMSVTACPTKASSLASSILLVSVVVMSCLLP